MRGKELWRKRLEAYRSRGHAFADPYEEKKSIEYLINAIESEAVRIDTDELMNLSAKILGASAMSRVLGAAITTDIVDKGLGNFFDDDDKPEGLDERVLHEKILPLLHKRLARIPASVDSELGTRLSSLQKTFRLNDYEREIVAFLFLLTHNELLSQHLQNPMGDCTSVSAFRNFGYTLAGIPRERMIEACTDGSLLTLNLIELRNAYLKVSDWCDAYLSGIGSADLIHQYFERASETDLAVEDFNIPANEVSVLDLLMRQEKGFNILFYGEPGTGKTALAKVLAKHYGMELLSVKIPQEGDVRVRMAAIHATLIFANPTESMVLIDEADEVLNTDNPFMFQVAQAKGWINTLLETYNKKVIWITNRSSLIHPSTMRRFSFSLHFKEFDTDMRFKVLNAELRRKGLEGFLSDAELGDLCKTYPVNAGGIVDALETLDITMQSDKEEALSRLKTILNSHARVTCEEGAVARLLEEDRDFSRYSLESINASEKIENIVKTVTMYCEARKKGQASLPRPLTILLYGPPGTGKTEFVRYLGHSLGQKVSLNRISDIQSMWVGQTERNIAAAFRDAAERGSILFFDEADSFLYPRAEAHHSWEKSFTNEMLTQIENHHGIVIFATNEMRGLDHASLRRFRFKVEFRPLTPDGALKLYRTMLAPLVVGGEEVSPLQQIMIQQIGNLTPGDFAVVRDQHQFMAESGVTHDMLIKSLRDEISYRNTGRKPIGFSVHHQKKLHADMDLS